MPPAPVICYQLRTPLEKHTVREEGVAEDTFLLFVNLCLTLPRCWHARHQIINLEHARITLPRSTYHLLIPSARRFQVLDVALGWGRRQRWRLDSGPRTGSFLPVKMKECTYSFLSLKL